MLYFYIFIGFPYCKKICCTYVLEKVYITLDTSIVLFLGAYDINIAYIF